MRTNDIINKIRIFIFCYKIPFYLMGLGNKKIKKLVWRDAARWLDKHEQDISEMDVFNLVLKNRNFASVYIYRYKSYKFLYCIKKIVFSYNQNIEINTPEVGGGLMVLHNLGAVISAEKIGENVSISQGVTIGKGGGRDKEKGGKPKIGNNVMITTNAIVLGKVDIGDDAIIGAGCVVTKDVPARAVVVGNPQRILKMQEE